MFKTYFCLVALSLTLLQVFQINPACMAQSPATQPNLDVILDGLESLGKDLTTLQATISKTEADASLGEDPETRTGQLWYDRRGDSDVRIRVHLATLSINGKERPDRIEYMLIDGTLTDRNYRSRVEAQRIVQKPGQKLDLFKLGQGPFPLPIGQPRASVYEQFEVAAAPSSSTDPANTTAIRLVPKSGTELSRKFARIDVWVDQSDFLPRQIITLNAQQTILTTTRLADVKLNTPIAADSFTLEKVNEKEWSIRIEAD